MDMPINIPGSVNKVPTWYGTKFTEMLSLMDEKTAGSKYLSLIVFYMSYFHIVSKLKCKYGTSSLASRVLYRARPCCLFS
jgi:hypothetical protein